MAKSKGALAQGPSAHLTTNVDDLKGQAKALQDRINRMGGSRNPNAKMLIDQLNGIKASIKKAGATPTGQSGPAAPPQEQAPQYTPEQSAFQNAAGQAGAAYGNVAQQVGQMGAFDPGSFADQQNAAYGHVMDQFERSMGPQFQQQEENFKQWMAERGVPPDSEQYAKEYQARIAGPQAAARQNAMDSAYGQGLSAQNQGYQQAAATYQMPFAQLQALQGGFSGLGQYAGQQGQFAFQGGQNALDRANQQALQGMGDTAAMQRLRYQLAHQKGGGGGGGGSMGLSYDQQLGLQNNAFYNNLALVALQNGQQMPQPGVGTGFATGIGQGVGIGIGGALR